jgi:hypothetical protein
LAPLHVEHTFPLATIVQAPVGAVQYDWAPTEVLLHWLSTGAGHGSELAQQTPEEKSHNPDAQSALMEHAEPGPTKVPARSHLFTLQM